MKFHLTTILILLLAGFQVCSQEVLLSENVKVDTLRPTHGPNLKKYVHPYFSLSCPVYENLAGSRIVNLLSPNFTAGVRIKRKLSPHYAIGYAVEYNSYRFRLEQESGKVLPDKVLNDKENIKFNTLGLNLYNRINFGKRGNHIGKYLDLGVYGDWFFSKRHEAINKNEKGEKVKVTTSKLKYASDFGYGITGRAGFNFLAVVVKYRLSDYFTAASGFPELPRLSVGLELGILKK